MVLKKAWAPFASTCKSLPSLRQFLSCIDVASHYCKVPINPPFIRPRLLIHFFFSPHISNSVCPLLLNPCYSFPSRFLLLLHSEGNVKLYLCRESVSSVEGEGAGLREEGGVSWPPSLGLKVRDLPKCQQSFDGGIDRIEAKGMIFTFFNIMASSRSDRDTANCCWANSVDSLCINAVCHSERIHLWINAFLCVAWYWYDVACTQARIWKC